MGVPRDDTLVEVVETASAALETPIEQLPPLYPVIDLDALDALISPTGSARRSPVTVTFEYAGLEITVHGHNLIYARPIGKGQDTPASADDVDP